MCCDNLLLAWQDRSVARATSLHRRRRTMGQPPAGAADVRRSCARRCFERRTQGWGGDHAVSSPPCHTICNMVLHLPHFFVATAAAERGDMPVNPGLEPTRVLGTRIALALRASTRKTCGRVSCPCGSATPPRREQKTFIGVRTPSNFPPHADFITRSQT